MAMEKEGCEYEGGDDGGGGDGDVDNRRGWVGG